MIVALTWSIAAAILIGIIFRPKDWPEAVWACAGAVLLVLCGLVAPTRALEAVARGSDVYLFLAGMMLLAELARREGVFAWLAGLAAYAAEGSRRKLFALVYGVGILVTVFLSNDATAVVLTPAVYAAVKKARCAPLPYLVICAFVANAASFVLPISNPANLVVYGKHLPPLLGWLRFFFLPSLLAITVTYIALRFLFRGDLAGEEKADGSVATLSPSGRRAAVSVVVTGAILIAASLLGLDLGLPTCLMAAVGVLTTTKLQRDALAQVICGVSWSVLPLVAGLFVMVEAVNRIGGLQSVRSALEMLTRLPKVAGTLTAAFGVAGLSNVMNNLPSGLLTGGALQASGIPDHLRHAVLIGVDLGPNLSVTGSLATVLWMIALRREGERITGWQFLKIGAIVMPPALLLATLALVLTTN